MSLQSQVSYIGKGEVFLQKRNTAGAKMLPIGNCISAQFSISENRDELQDYTSTGGGLLETNITIKSVMAKLKVTNLSPTNLAIALRGQTTAGTAATITDESHAGVLKGSLIRLARLPDITATITVKKGATVIASAGNWQATSAGIWVSDTAPDITADDTLLITYSAIADNVVQALVSSNDEYTMIFSGLNEARSGKPVVVTAHRIKFSPAKTLDLISDKFAELEIEGDVLADATITGNGISKFLKVEMASQAA